MTKSLRILCTVGLALVGFVSGLIASAARNDFTFRGCHELPRSEWDATANCTDGWFAQVVFGGLCLGLIIAMISLWIWRPNG